MTDVWPERVGGWELARHGDIENYRRCLTNGVTVIATWYGKPGNGTVQVHVEPSGLGRTLTSSRTKFRDRESFWTAAHCLVELAANLPSLGYGRGSPAELAVAGEVAGTVEAEPGTSGVPGAELTFTLLSGQTVSLSLTDEQAFDLCASIDSLDKHVWSEEREDEDEEDDYDDEADYGEDEATETIETIETIETVETGDAEVPEVPDAADVSGIEAGPDTGHDVVTLLDTRFGVTEDFLMAHIDWSAVIVVGEPAVSSLIERGEELYAALQPRWYPVVADRPCERWVVLRRTGLNYGDESA